MRILVCVKSVPKGDSVPFDPELGSLRRDKAAQALNPADCAALEQAFRLKERYGATITVLSVGPRATERLLYEICALPVDNTVLATDLLYAGSDTLATARILAAAASFMGGFDLILLGRRAIDGETGHVGPELAALLAITACATNITGDCSIDAAAILCTRLLEDTLQSLRVPLPAVLTICGGEYTLRPPSIAGMRSARPVTLLTNNDLALPPDAVGLVGSPTVVARIRPAWETRRSLRLIRNAEEGASAIMEALSHEPIHHACPESAHSCPVPEGQFWVVSLLDDVPSKDAARELIAAAYALSAAPILINLHGEDDVACARALAKQALKEQPAIILLPATIRGRNVAPYCAALLQTGLSADCTELTIDDLGRLRQFRPAFGDSLMAEIYCRAWPQMATVRPGVFIAGDTEPTAVKILDALGEDTRPEILAVTPLGTEGLHEAKVIVAGGRGIGNKEGFAHIGRLADKIGAAVGASRSAVDAGLAPYTQQIGQTGATVRPNVYIAFAISGAVQHLAGIRDSGLIIAVNTDPMATIFSHADIGVVARWDDVARILERNLKNAG